MKSPRQKHLIQFWLAFVGTLLAIIWAFVEGKLTPRETGGVSLVDCLIAIVALTILLRPGRKESAIAKVGAPEGVSAAARKRILRNIRRCKIAIVVMAIFVYASCSTGDDPLWTRMVGATINIVITIAFIVALRHEKAKLSEFR